MSKERNGRRMVFIAVLLAIEFFDELVYGLREAAWPLMRDDLALTYTQVGLLISVPIVLGSLVDPVIGILGDAWKRRVLVLGGGVVYVTSLLLIALSPTFFPLLIAFTIVFSASGAYVSLSQATLMDVEPKRHEQNMARWTLAGSVGVVAGPLLLGTVIALGGSWRTSFIVSIIVGLGLLIAAWISPFPKTQIEENEGLNLIVGLKGAWVAFRNRTVLRWLVLLMFSDLMLDVLLGYLALYMVDVGGVTAGQAGIAVAVWSGFGLLGDFLLIPILERVEGLAYLRVSAIVELVLYVLLLLVPSYVIKLILLALLGMFNAGWYAILMGHLYSAMPGRSGTVMTVNGIFGLLEGAIPIGLGLAATGWGLNAAMWLLVAGPLALLIWLPRHATSTSTGDA